MRRVTWAVVATDNPMGQQHYEVKIQAALAAAADPEWHFETLRVSSLRSQLPGVRRTPTGLYARATPATAFLLGAAAYRTRGLVHRFDLRLPPHPGPEVVTVHDLPPARFDDEGTLPRSIAAGARHARAVITPSRFAESELRELLGVERVHVIPYGLSDEYTDPAPATDDELAAIGITGRFVLHAAGATRRKNLAGLADAWRELSAAYDDLQLVLCGPPDARRERTFAGLERVLTPGRVPARTVAALMCRAAAVVVPSTYEGFGLPALEGMACGAPVVAADAGALPEVCADAALLVPPTGEGIADGLRRVLDDAAIASDLAEQGRARARTFSWERAARAHLEVYATALDE